MEKQWVRINSKNPKAWYMVSNYGEMYRCWEVMVDAAGRTRPVSDLKRKNLRPEIRFKKSHFYENEIGSLIARLDLPEGKKHITLHHLVAECFFPPPSTFGIKYYLEFIDGNAKNCRVDNLRWVTRSESVNFKRKKAEKLAHPKNPLMKYTYWKIPQDHEVYKHYREYLINNQKNNQIILEFFRKEKLYSGKVLLQKRKKKKVTESKTYYVDVYTIAISDDDPVVLKHDLDLLGDQVCTAKGIWYPVKKNSKIMKRWLNYIDKKKVSVMDLPDLDKYVKLGEGITDRKHDKYFSYDFLVEKNDLYVKIKSQREIIAEDFIRVQEECENDD